jgi:hypothetical protein
MLVDNKVENDTLYNCIGEKKVAHKKNGFTDN